MAPPDPNPKVTLAGSGVLLHALRSTDNEPIPLVADASGALSTSGGGGGGGGSVTQGAGSGTAAGFWTVQLSNGSAYLPLPTALGAGGGLKIDGSGTALPISAASLPLPSGAATDAKLGGGLPAALGAGGGLKIDGSGTALPVSGTVTTTPSGTQNVAAASQAATAFFPVRISIDGSNFAASVTPNTGVNFSANVGLLGSLLFGKRTGANQIDAVATNSAGAILVSGSDGSVQRTLATNASGQVVSVGAGTSGSPSGGVASVQGTVTTAPTVTAPGLPVRVIPTVSGGLEIHAQTSAAITNAANKLLFGFTNNTGADVFVSRVNLSNKQSATIAGVVGTMSVQIGTGAITAGTTVNSGSSPALVAACFDVRNAVPADIVFNTGGTLGGTVYTLENANWSTDEVSANGTGLAAEIAAKGVYADVFNFEDNPIVVPNGYSCGVVCDAALTNGQTLVDFNIQRTS